MNRVKGFFLALVLLIATFLSFDFITWKIIDRVPKPFMRNFSFDSKYVQPDVLRSCIDEGTFVIMGSSELNHASKSLPYPFELFNYPEFNTLKIGQGGYQSIIHAGIIGAIGNSIQNKKAMLILSPQWFTESGVDKCALPSFLSIETVCCYLCNDNIPDDLKDRYLDRLLTLTGTLPEYQEKILQANSARRFFSVSDKINLKLKLQKDKIEHRIAIIRILQDINHNSCYRNEPLQFDFDLMLENAEKTSAAESYNNDFNVANSYYDTYIRPVFDESRNRDIELSYSDSPEYDDLELFLETAGALGIKLCLVSMPVHGKWSDYTGFPKEKREEYYENIRQLAAEKNVRLLDLSSHEYDPYFLKDIMHIGEKGWVYIDREILDFR